MQANIIIWIYVHYPKTTIFVSNWLPRKKAKKKKRLFVVLTSDPLIVCMTYKSSVYLSKYVVSNYCTNGLSLFNWKKRVKFFCLGLHVLLVKMKTSALLLQSSLRSLVTTKGKTVHFCELWTFCVRNFVKKRKKNEMRKNNAYELTKKGIFVIS